MKDPATKLVGRVLGICLGLFLVINFIAGVHDTSDPQGMTRAVAVCDKGGGRRPIWL